MIVTLLGFFLHIALFSSKLSIQERCPYRVAEMSSKTLVPHRVWWHTPLIIARGRQTQVDFYEFKTSLL